MSEYQYYEFKALDHPLTQSQMEELRTYSARARITPTSFVNIYNSGRLRGYVVKWMEIYFDVFLYLANWGHRELIFRVPKHLIDLNTISAYYTAENLTCYTKDEYAIISFDMKKRDAEQVDGKGWMTTLIPLRSDLLQGDLRSFYLGWLVAVQEGRLDDNTPEPPVPPGLGQLSTPLEGLVEFLLLDSDLVAAAAEKSAEEQTSLLTQDAIADWVAHRSPTEKDEVIATLIRGEDSYFAAKLRQRAIREILNEKSPGLDPNNDNPRTVGQLTKRAKTLAEERRLKAAEIRAREKAKQIEVRKNYLESLIGKEEDLWLKVDALITSRHPRRYDEAISLIQDLHELAGMTHLDQAFVLRMEALSLEHRKKTALINRLRKADLLD